MALRPSADVTAQLQNIERLLIAPDPAAMRTCERDLQVLVTQFQQTGVAPLHRSRMERLLRNIRFLLDQANAFWESRRRALTPARQYTSSGALASLVEVSILNFEV